MSCDTTSLLDEQQSVLHFYSPARGIDYVQMFAWTQPPLLLSVMRELALPLYWKCHHGTCGACAVHVAGDAELSGTWAALTAKERNVLRRHGYPVPDTPSAPPIGGWRLACLLPLPAGMWRVSWGDAP